ncbi:MAG: hypothetical protein GY765_43485, partial [bacterium]|nr:hypothetical protein [bacterium]
MKLRVLCMLMVGGMFTMNAYAQGVSSDSVDSAAGFEITSINLVKGENDVEIRFTNP